ncbi:Flp pilus assembly protein CpaB [Phycicoccus sp. CSK15P-2]|uniref:RcpC/CpaB family pilus assembly protein n=1 Tax=Phycicoccus sp. CSK15P-2 TaxID=2807627 RepID=UPI001951BBA7|nr:RcpC/CpaB family pilus assembly protein [Phycicoccus sp. CSK15P-2]MBM6405980.1 Flp pilus assembly protein CpaB [Phycicoccus sp. CSK15P-2]
MGKRILAILAAAVIALVGAVFVLLYARGADARAVEAASPTTVYTTTALIPAGTSLKDAVRQGQVVETEVASRAKPVGALEAVNDDNSALVALTDIAPGQYVLSAGFGDTPLGEKALQVGSGKLAVSVQLQDPARVGTFVTPGSNLTIFMTYELKETSGKEGSEETEETSENGTGVLLENVKVIAMGEASLTPAQPTGEGEEAAPQGASFLVTVEVDPAQAVRLVHGINNYTLYAGLRGSEVKLPKDLQISDSTIAKDTTR